jgi:hypothetical protein
MWALEVVSSRAAAVDGPVVWAGAAGPQRQQRARAAPGSVVTAWVPAKRRRPVWPGLDSKAVWGVSLPPRDGRPS